MPTTSMQRKLERYEFLQQAEVPGRMLVSGLRG